MMKRNVLRSMLQQTILGVGLVSLLLGTVGCDSSDNDLDKLLGRHVDNTKPEFTQEDFDAIPQNYEETSNGTWKISKVNGIVCQIIFAAEGVDPAPSPASPKTPEDFFINFLPVTADNQMVFYDRDYRNDPHYHQYYKGVPVERGFWHFYFFEDGVMQSAYGKFIPIGQLDVNPVIDIKTAKKIVKNYIHSSIEGEGKHFYLSIMSFPENGELKPRLVYVYKRQEWEMGEFVYVDAKTGRLLFHYGYWGG